MNSISGVIGEPPEQTWAQYVIDIRKDLQSQMEALETLEIRLCACGMLHEASDYLDFWAIVDAMRRKK